MKILVTGGAGFIGSHTVKKLIKLGHQVVIVDNFNDYYDPQLKEDRIKIFLKGLKFKLYRLDIADYKKLEKVFKKERFDKIIHLAAQAGVRYSLTHPFVYERSNILGTLNLLELCRHYKVRDFIFASTSSVYGNSRQFPCREDSRTDQPISLYSATKKADEVLAYAYHNLYGLRCVALRFFNVYGIWDRPDLALPKFVRNILADKPVEIYGRGQMSRDFTHINDIVEGIVVVVRKSFKYEIFNLGRSHPEKLMDFIKMIEKYLGKKAKKKMMPMQAGDVRATWADVSKARRLLGYRPKVKIRDGIGEYVEWYREYYKNKTGRG